jgi:hypothetical protein
MVPNTQPHHRKYKSGGVGVLTHLAVLQGTNYSCELEVYCDGYLLKSVALSPRTFVFSPTEEAIRLFDPYNRPVLHVRRPSSDVVEEYKFLDDDPFLTEISELVDVMEHRKPVENLLSTFEGTYDCAGSLFRFVLTLTLHLPAVRCVQDVRTHVGDSQGRRRDACKTKVDVGVENWKSRYFGMYWNPATWCGYPLYNVTPVVVKQ